MMFSGDRRRFVKGIDLGKSPAVPTALFLGMGNATNPETTADANKNFIGSWTKSTAATGDSRGAYLRHYLGAAGSGEALRAFCTATASGVAAGGTANGIHATMSLDASASISGQAHAIRATLAAAADTRTLNANLAVVNLDSDIATGNTVPATVAFLKCTDAGAVPILNFAALPAVGNGLMVAAHTSQTNTHSLKITCGGTVYYVPCHATATGRS
jgi:hypothetical protein